MAIVKNYYEKGLEAEQILLPYFLSYDSNNNITFKGFLDARNFSSTVTSIEEWHYVTL